MIWLHIRFHYVITGVENSTMIKVKVLVVGPCEVSLSNHCVVYSLMHNTGYA